MAVGLVGTSWPVRKKEWQRILRMSPTECWVDVDLSVCVFGILCGATLFVSLTVVGPQLNRWHVVFDSDADELIIILVLL